MPASTSAGASSFSVLPEPTKSSNDKKDYKVIALRNGLRVLLISDTSYPLDKLAEEEATVLVCSMQWSRLVHESTRVQYRLDLWYIIFSNEN